MSNLADRIKGAKSVNLRSHYNLCPHRRVCHAVRGDLSGADGPGYFLKDQDA